MVDMVDGGAARELLVQLLMSDTEEAVIEALKAVGLWDDPKSWRLLGDREDNYGTAGAQATIPEAALVEKITNAIDANLMRQAREAGIDPRGPLAPRSVRDAVARFYDENPHASFSGDVSSWDDRKIREVARATTSISLTGRPEKRLNRKANYPSITILDRGEGQAPEKQPSTILSLGKSLKLDINFQQGKFNMGGTAALRFCGEHHLQLILSRRAPTLADADGESKDWGFTVVRKDYKSGERMSAYRYLAPLYAGARPSKGEILRFGADTLLIGPHGNEAYVEPVDSGTLIKLYQYQTNYTTSFGQTDGLRHQLDVWMPQLPLPVRLHECRYPGDPRSFEWNLTGLSRRLSVASSLAFADSGTMMVDGQPFAYQLFCLSEGNARRYRGDHGVIFSVNGQAHGTIHPRIFARKAVGLAPLKDDLTVIVDCTEVDVPHLEDLTSNSRDRLADSMFRRRVEAKVEEVLSGHRDLRRLSHERAEARIREKVADQRPLEEVLRAIFRRSDALKSLFVMGRRLGGSAPLVPTPVKEKFEGKTHPTEFYFKGLAPDRRLERNCHLGQRLRIDFETDVENGYFRRATLPGKYTVEAWRDGKRIPDDELTYIMNLHNGIAHLNMELPSSAEVGDQLRLLVRVEDDTLITPFINEACITVRREQPPAKSSPGKRDSREPKGEDKLALRPAGVEFPSIREITADAWEQEQMTAYSALRIENLGQSEANSATRYLFKVNVDNPFLTKEQRARPSSKDILKAQWIHGLVLVGLGLLRDLDESPTAENPDQLSDEEYVARASDGIAPVLLPMIVELGRLSDDDLAELAE